MQSDQQKISFFINQIDDRIKNPLSVILFTTQDLIEHNSNNQKLKKKLKIILSQSQQIQKELKQLYQKEFFNRSLESS